MGIQIQGFELDTNGQVIPNTYSSIFNLIGPVPMNYRGRPGLTRNEKLFNISGNPSRPILYVSSGTSLKITSGISNTLDDVRTVALGTGEADITVAAASVTLTAVGSVVKFSPLAVGNYLECDNLSSTATATNNTVTLAVGQRTLMKLNYSDNSGGNANRYALVELVAIDFPNGVASFRILEDVHDYTNAATIDWRRYIPN